MFTQCYHDVIDTHWNGLSMSHLLETDCEKLIYFFTEKDKTISQRM
jgi:hypothetical protein